MINWLLAQYEARKFYKANPCDRDAAAVLAPFGRAAARLASHCPCCNGYRMLALVALTAICPTGTPIAVGVVYLALLITEIVQPTKDENESNE